MKKHKLTFFMLINILSIASVSLMIIGFIWIYDTQMISPNDVNEIEAIQIEFIETELQGKVDAVVDYIQFRRAQTEKVLKDNLQERTYEGYSQALECIYIKRWFMRLSPLIS